MVRDPDMALRLAVALAPWWLLRGRPGSARCCARPPGTPRRAATGGAPRTFGSVMRRCSRPICPGRGLLHPRLRRYRGPAAVQGTGGCLRGRSGALANIGRVAEAADDARRSLALALALGDPAREAMALDRLAVAVFRAGDLHTAVQLAVQAGKTSVDVPGWIAALRKISVFLALVLTKASRRWPQPGPRLRGRGWTRARRAGDSWVQTRLLVQRATLDLRAGPHPGRRGAPAGGTADRREDRRPSSSCQPPGLLRVPVNATGRYAEAVTILGGAWRAPPAPGVREFGLRRRKRQQEALRKARRALGPGRARAAEERGTAMSRRHRSRLRHSCLPT